MDATPRPCADSSFMLSARVTWYLRHSLSSCCRPGPAPPGGAEMLPGSGDTSFGGVGGNVKRCGLEWPADREEDEADGYTDRLVGEPWCSGFLGKGLRFQGDELWCGAMPLLPSSQGSEPWSIEGRHTWLPAAGKTGNTPSAHRNTPAT